MQKSQHRNRTLVVAGALIASLIALYAAAGFLAVPRLLTSIARETVRTNYGRELAIGEVRFNPFTLALEVNNLSLPDADGGPLLAFDRLLVDLELNSLWRRALSFRAISLDGLAVQVVVRPGGAFNLADLRTPVEPGAPPAKDEPLPRLFIGDLTVTGGRVRFEDRDRPEPYMASLAPLTFRLTKFSTYITEGDHYELDATLLDSSRLAWRGTLTAQPLSSDGEFTLSALPLPKLAAYLGDKLRLQVTRGAASLHGRYHFASRPAGIDFVVHDGNVLLTGLAVRDRGEQTDYLELEEVTATGMKASLAEKTAVVSEVTLAGGRIQTWLTPDGELKRSGLFDPMAGPAAGPSVSAATGSATDQGWSVSIPRINLRSLGLSLEDRSLTPAPALVLQPLNVTIDGYSTAPATTVKVALDATVNAGGTLKVAATTSVDTLATEADIEAAGIELAMAQPYIARESSLTLTDGTLAVKGKLSYAAGKPAADLGFTGDVTIDGLRTTDNVLREDFVKWDALRLAGIEYRSAPESLRIASIDARSPYARVIIGPDGTTNVSAILAGPGAVAARVPGPTVGPAESRGAASVAVTKPAPAAASRAAPFPVRIGMLKIRDGSVGFADFTTRPNFSIGIEKLKGTIAGLSSDPASRASIDLDGQVDRFSPVTIRGQVNPLAAETFLDMAMTFRNVELASFTPYSGRFAGYAIRQGKLSADLNYKATNRQLDADHKFVINQLELGDKVESPDAVSLPLKLAVALLKDRNGVIDLDLPVTGEMDDPKFRIGPIVWKVLVNLLTKAVTAPFALLGKLFGGGEEINLIDFPAGESGPDTAGREKIQSLVQALNDRPGLQLTVPAVFNSATDGPPLMEAGLEANLVAARKSELAARKQPVEGVTFASLSADPKAYLKLLTTVYRQEFGADAQLPEPPPDATDPAARIGLLEDALRQRAGATDVELYALARSRAEAVQSLLLTDTGIDPGRVFLVAPVEGQAGDGGVIMELALR